MTGLAYVGKIVELRKIDGADRILSATVVCGAGGKWQCVVPLDLQVDQLVTCFLPDSLVPELTELEFMRKNHWRVRMSRFKGSPSEALALASFVGTHQVGDDVTEELNVQKFIKPLPLSLGGDILGDFPDHLVPRTDELRYQAVPEMVQIMQDREYYATKKIDGTSVTVINDGHIRVCSRNYEMKDTPNSALWKTVKAHNFDGRLDEGLALQFELAGPSIQGNPLKLTEITPFVFNMWSISNSQYLNRRQMLDSPFANYVVPCLYSGLFAFNSDELQQMADSVTYGDKPGEGLVFRPHSEITIQIPSEVKPQRVSFKVINLNYKD